jgi:hypothetical protein
MPSHVSSNCINTALREIKIKTLLLYSHHFIFFITYECANKARELHTLIWKG